MSESEYVPQNARLVSPHAAFVRRAGDWALDWVVRPQHYIPYRDAHGFFSDLFWALYEGGARDIAEGRDHLQVLQEVMGDEATQALLPVTRANLAAALVVASEATAQYVAVKQEEEEQASPPPPQPPQDDGDEDNPSTSTATGGMPSGGAGNGRGQSFAQRVAQKVAQALRDKQDQIEQVAAVWNNSGGDKPEEQALSGGGWGTGEGNPVNLNPTHLLRLVEEVQGLADVLAELGRAEGVLEQARRSVKRTGVVGRIGFTSNPMRALKSEVALFSPAMPPIVRARQLQKFASGRAIGLDWGEGKRRGALAVVVDESGSMDALIHRLGKPRIAIAKAIAGAVMRAAMAEGRAVLYTGFASEGEQFVTPVRSRLQFLEAIAHFYNGGTSILDGLNAVVEAAANDQDMAEGGVDILLLTDAEEFLNADAVRRWWEEWVQDIIPGTRLRMVFIGGEAYDDTLDAFRALEGVKVAAADDALEGERAFARFAAEVLEDDYE